MITATTVQMADSPAMFWPAIRDDGVVHILRATSYGDEDEAYRVANGHLSRAMVEARRKLRELGFEP